MLIALLILAVLYATPVAAQAGPAGGESVSLIECADRGMAFKMLCNPTWPAVKDEDSVVMDVSREKDEKVTVTVTRAAERGLTWDEVNPVALKDVYGYADGFRFARTKVKGRRSVRIEARLSGDPDLFLLDYFFIRQDRIYRVSFAAASRQQYRKYLPLFAQMVRSLEFVSFPGE